MVTTTKILECLRCGTGFNNPWMFEGCPKCAEAGYNVNLSAVIPSGAAHWPGFPQPKEHLSRNQAEGTGTSAASRQMLPFLRRRLPQTRAGHRF